MPAAIPIVAAVASTAAATAFTGTAFTLFAATSFAITVSWGAVIATGIAVAGALLQFALTPKPASPRFSAERQLTTNQAATYRMRCFGRVKVGGALALYDASPSGNLVQVVVHGQGPHLAAVEHELDGEAVTLDGSGWVQTPEKWRDRVRIVSTLGATDQAATQVLLDELPYLDASFRLRGLAYTVAIQKPVRAQEMAKVYPAGALSYRQTVDGAVDVYDPRDGSTGWSDNAALLVAWRLTSDDGHALPSGRINWATFEAAADVCDELVPLKAGGTEKRYRASGRFGYDTEPAEVTRALLASCDGDLYLDDDGRVAIRIGYQEPSNAATYEARHVAAMRWRRGQGILDRYNAVIANYVDPDRDWQPVSAPAFEDAADIAASGVRRSLELDLGFVTSGTQAQRLAEIALGKVTPAYQGSVTTNLAGLASRQRAACRLAFAEAPTSLPLRVNAANIDLASLTVAMDVQTVDASAYAWDAETDEREIPAAPLLAASGQVQQPPQSVVFAPVEIDLDAATAGAAVRAAFTPLADETFGVELQVSPAGAGEWASSFSETATAGVIVSGPQSVGATVDARVRFVGPGGGVTPWVETTGLLVTSGLAAPIAPTGQWGPVQDVNGFVEPVRGTVTVANQPNLWRLRVYRSIGAASVFADAVEIATIYDVSLGAYQIAETAPALGALRYWALLENTGGVQSAVAGPYDVTATD